MASLSRLHRAYTLILLLNRWFNRVPTRLGLNYWSMSQYLQHQIKNAVNFISQFEKIMTDEARRRSCDGVVCGHIHKAEIRDIDGILHSVLQRRRAEGHLLDRHALAGSASQQGAKATV